MKALESVTIGLFVFAFILAFVLAAVAFKAYLAMVLINWFSESIGHPLRLTFWQTLAGLAVPSIIAAPFSAGRSKE